MSDEMRCGVKLESSSWYQPHYCQKQNEHAGPHESPIGRIEVVRWWNGQAPWTAIAIPDAPVPAPRSSSTGTPAPRCTQCGKAKAEHTAIGPRLFCFAVHSDAYEAHAQYHEPVAPPSRDASEPCPDDPPCDECLAIRDGIEDAPTRKRITLAEARAIALAAPPPYTPPDAEDAPTPGYDVREYDREQHEARVGRSLLAALETVDVGDTLAIYSNSDGFGVSRIIGRDEHGNAATRRLAAALQRVKG
jgi:hypothetical protein